MFPGIAFVGVRACEIAAMAVQDRVFTAGAFGDPDYRERRERSLVVAVSCVRSADTCFCVSMGTGPRSGPGFDAAVMWVAACVQLAVARQPAPRPVLA